MQLLPQIMDTDFSRLIIQNFVGEATIAPSLTLRDLARTLTNPTVPEIDRFIRVGRQETWRKMGLISTRFRIAQALQALVSRGGTEREAGLRSEALDHTTGLRQLAERPSHRRSPRPSRSPARERATRREVGEQRLAGADQPASEALPGMLAEGAGCRVTRFF